jgi:hypothetical protein
MRTKTGCVAQQTVMLQSHGMDKVRTWEGILPEMLVFYFYTILENNVVYERRLYSKMHLLNIIHESKTSIAYISS